MSWLRRMLGRELSPKEMEKCRANVQENKGDAEYFMINDFFVLRESSRSWKSTPDASEGSRVMHTGFYLDFIRSRIYDKDGLLVREANIDTRSFFKPEGKLKEFNPPGRIFGKRVSDTCNFINYLHTPVVK